MAKTKRPRTYVLVQQGVNLLEVEAYKSIRGIRSCILTAKGPIYPAVRTLRALAKRFTEMADWIEHGS